MYSFTVTHKCISQTSYRHKQTLSTLGNVSQRAKHSNDVDELTNETQTFREIGQNNKNDFFRCCISTKILDGRQRVDRRLWSDADNTNGIGRLVDVRDVS